MKSYTISYYLAIIFILFNIHLISMHLYDHIHLPFASISSALYSVVQPNCHSVISDQFEPHWMDSSYTLWKEDEENKTYKH